MFVRLPTKVSKAIQAVPPLHPTYKKNSEHIEVSAIFLLYAVIRLPAQKK